MNRHGKTNISVLTAECSFLFVRNVRSHNFRSFTVVKCMLLYYTELVLYTNVTCYDITVIFNTVIVVLPTIFVIITKVGIITKIE